MSIIEKYTTPSNPGSFAGLSGFKKNNLKIDKLDQVKNYETYSLHKLAKRKFKRRKTIVNGIDHFWQVDLIDMSKVMYVNRFFKFLLTIIDVFSKFAWVVPLKNKSAQSSKEAFEKIFKLGRKPQYIYSDWGNEFKGVCKKLFKDENIVHIDTKSTKKAAVIERFNRTLKEKMYRYFTDSKSNKYIDVLDDLVKNYNSSYHRSIGTKPILVTKENEHIIRKRLYGDEDDEIIKFSFKIGEYVRVVNDKKLFEKGYTSNWSKEIYIINFLNPTVPPTYKIKSLDGTEYDWNYYKEELQLVSSKEFPYDSYQILEDNNKYLIKKLNTDKEETEWINKNE